MNKLNLLTPDKNNLYLYLYTGIVLFSLSIIIVLSNSFFNLDLMYFLPEKISFFLPLVVGFIGLHLIRIEFSGIKLLDTINKKINTNKFNALLSLLILFVVIKSLPPLLNWFIIDANFSGDSKDACSGSGACWAYIKTWLAPLAQVAEHGGRVVVHAVEHEHPQQRRRLVVVVFVVVVGGGGGGGGGGVCGVGGGGGGACALGRGIGRTASEAGRWLAELLQEGLDLREER